MAATANLQERTNNPGGCDRHRRQSGALWLPLALLLCWGQGTTALQAMPPDHREALNTARNAAYLTENEREVIRVINKLRTDPPGFAQEFLEPLLSRYRGNQLVMPGELPLVTHEGVSALREAIRELKNATPVPLLHPDERLSKAAADHMRDQSASGRTGHAGSDGSTFRSRIEKYGSWERILGENIFYGDPGAWAVVVHLVIDDGIPERGHRKNFLNPGFRLAGVASGTHPVWRNVCVIDFAGGFCSEGAGQP